MGKVGKRLIFNGQLIEEHGKGVLHHGMKRQEAHTLAAGRGQNVDEVDAVVTHNLLQCDLQKGGGGEGGFRLHSQATEEMEFM